MKFSSRLFVIALGLFLAVPSLGVPLSFAATPPASSYTCNFSAPLLGIAFNPVNNRLYVPLTSGIIEVITGSCKVISNVSVGGCPQDAAYDVSTQTMYVTNPCTNSVALIKGTSVVGNLTGPNLKSPENVAYDPGTKNMYVGTYGGGASSSSYNVTIIHGTKIVKNIFLNHGNGLYFNDGFFAYSPSTHEMWVTYTPGSPRVSIIADSCLCVTGYALVGNHSTTGIAYNPSNGDIYVASWVASPTPNDTVYALNPSTRSVVGSVVVGKETMMLAYSSKTHEIYAANQGGGSPKGGSVSVIKGLSLVNTLLIPGGPRYLAYDSANGLVYATLSFNNVATTISA